MVKRPRARKSSGSIHLPREEKNLEIPLGILCVVTGVSGSGKSQLIMHELASEVGRQLGQTPESSSSRQIANLVCMDERSVPLSSQSTPATLLQIWPAIRSHFAATDEARRRNFETQSFGLSRGSLGRCPACEGRGTQAVDLQFLPEAKILCPECRGRRYRPELLEITYRGLNIAEVLELDLQQSLTHFRGDNAILRRITSAVALGLESLQLGRPISELATGEVQRLKLARHLSKRSGGSTLFLLDEPTTGLHPNDVHRLVDSLNQLVSAGHAVIAIDHHPQLLKAADQILDLGIEGNRPHPSVVAQGTLAEVIASPNSATGTFWRQRS